MSDRPLIPALTFLPSAIKTMRVLFNLFLDICLFRKGPQDTPASLALLKMCLAAYGLTSLLALLIGTSALVALLQTLVDLALLSGLLYLALRLYRHPRRFEQTLSALTGVGALISVLALPLLFWIGGQSPGGNVELPALLLLALMVWSIAVMAHILRHALNVPMWVGALYALSYTFLSWQLTGWVGSSGP
ncbi:MAG: hypothetical protein EKK68_13305 [Candidatus Competibacteraceae bacterium]|nr:MAG: hypothetical protein EKK68_13305 [Candidatus Competibacteraceae bacterium]